MKVREDDGRAVSCVAAQARLAERGFPCALPLTPAVRVGVLAVHAEEFRPGGELLPGDSPDVAVRYAAVFARLMAELADVTVAPPLPNPRWARWDHRGSSIWPEIDFLDSRDQRAVPAYVVETARRVRTRLLAADLPCVLGHADFEAQNLRWHDRTGGDVWAVHDWDSLAWQLEAALVGAASAGAPRRGRSPRPPPSLGPTRRGPRPVVGAPGRGQPAPREREARDADAARAALAEVVGHYLQLTERDLTFDPYRIDPGLPARRHRMAQALDQITNGRAPPSGRTTPSCRDLQQPDTGKCRESTFG
nr:hypothetical protein [Dactylosporangium matsuzakiense]